MNDPVKIGRDNMETALSNLRILDISDGPAGSIAGLLLAECGADVIKVEPRAGASWRDRAVWAIWNRSKRSIALDLGDERDRAILASLLEKADVIIHDHTPLSAQTVGLDHSTLAATHGHLIVAAIGGYPDNHPDAELPVDDALVLAKSGLMGEQPAVRRDGPTYLRFPLASWNAAYLTANGIVARLISLSQGGPIGPVKTSLLQGALIAGQFFRFRAERADASIATTSRGNPATLFECADGRWIHVMPPFDKCPLLQETIANLPLPDGASLSNFEKLKRAFKQRDGEQWLAALWSSDVPAMSAEQMGTVYMDQQARECGYVVPVHDPLFGPTLQPSIGIKVTPDPSVRNAAPTLDGDRASVLEGWNLPNHKPRSAACKKSGYLLEGIKVVDFGAFLAGPLAALLLADLGATVIKVEPITGDPMRMAGWAFQAAHRNKRSLALNLRDPRARPVIERLIRDADVVHHNLRMPAAERLGLGYEALSQINPNIIYSHVSSYGPQGPRRDWPGFDQLMQAFSGWERETGGAENPPSWCRFGMMDHLAALSSVLATLLAMKARLTSSKGQAVAASILGAAALTTESVQLADGSLTDFEHIDPMQYGLSAGRRLYRAIDGWLYLHAGDVALRRLRTATAVDLEAWFSSHTVAEGIEAATTASATAVSAPTGYCDTFLDDPANAASGLVATLPHANYGKFTQVGSFWDFGNMETRLDSAAPVTGQHSRSILRDLGFAQDEIEQMITSGLVNAA